MENLDIVELVSEYGQSNIRIRLYEKNVNGFFTNPLAGWTEYVIDKINHELYLSTIDSVAENVAGFSKGSNYESLMQEIFDKKSFYVADFNQFSKDRVQVYVLVDEDNKYKRLY